jgi:hypothetical protein
MNDFSPQLTYYRPSGITPVPGAVATLVLSAVAGSLLGAVYAFVNHHDPWLYINVFLVVGFGFSLGWIVSLGVRKFRVRNVLVAAITGFLVFASAWITHWFFYVSTVIVDLNTDSSYDAATIVEMIVEIAFGLMRDPESMWEVILDLNREGLWSLAGSSGGDAGFAPQGIVLALLWGAEALVICYFSVKKPWNEASKPYSERLDRWMDPQTAPVPVAFIENVNDFKNAVSRNDYSALTTPLPSAGDEENENTKYATLDLYSDSFDSYVSVQNVSIKLKKKAKGRAKKRKEDVTKKEIIRYLKIPSEVARTILKESQ